MDSNSVKVKSVVVKVEPAAWYRGQYEVRTAIYFDNTSHGFVSRHFDEAAASSVALIVFNIFKSLGIKVELKHDE